MKKTKRSYTKPIAYILILFIMIAGVYLWWRKNHEVALTPPAGADNTTITSKEKVIKTTVPTNSTDLPANPQTTTSDQVPTADTLSVTITSTKQTNGVVSASAMVSQDGLCVFTYSTPNDKPVVKQVTSNNKTCSVDISQNEFSYLGTWKLTVTFYSNGSKAEDTKNVAIS